MLPSKMPGSEANIGFGCALMPSFLRMRLRRQHF